MSEEIKDFIRWKFTLLAGLILLVGCFLSLLIGITSKAVEGFLLAIGLWGGACYSFYKSEELEKKVKEDDS